MTPIPEWQPRAQASSSVITCLRHFLTSHAYYTENARGLVSEMTAEYICLCLLAGNHGGYNEMLFLLLKRLNYTSRRFRNRTDAVTKKYYNYKRSSIMTHLPYVRVIGAHVKLSTRVKVLLCPRDWCHYPLVVHAQSPPLWVVIRRCNPSREHFPSPLIHK